MVIGGGGGGKQRKCGNEITINNIDSIIIAAFSIVIKWTRMCRMCVYYVVVEGICIAINGSCPPNSFPPLLNPDCNEVGI